MFRKLGWLIVILLLGVVVAGALVRLSDATLACGEWPGCFGQFGMPDTQTVDNYLQNFPQSTASDLGKARVLMSYRYFLGLSTACVFAFWILSFFTRVHRKAAILLISAMFACWAIHVGCDFLVARFKLMPFWVLSQFLSGLTALGLSFWIVLSIDSEVELRPPRSAINPWIQLSLLVLFVEILLGGWTAANYAALACAEFPTCSGSFWPRADYFHIFSVFRGGDYNYYGGVLSHEARIAIHWLHRLGAFLSFVVLGGLSLSLSSLKIERRLRKAGVVLSALLLLQIASGIASVLFAMPRWAALAHTAIAALMLLNVLYVQLRIGRFARQRPIEEWVERGIEPARVEVAKDVVALEAAAETLPEVEIPAQPVSLFQRLTTQLKRTRSGLTEILAAIPIGKKEIDADLLEDIESSLILADVGVEASREIIDNLTRSVQRKELGDASALYAALRENLLALLEPCDVPLRIAAGDKTFVILVVGVNGVGKTTTIGKLAKRLQAQGLSVMLAAGDTFRAAAIEQLQAWGERNSVPVVAQHSGADSASVVFDAFQSAKARGIDVLIADTAGRLHTKDNLMEELRKVKRILAKLDSDAPHEVLLVVDAGTGQNALSQADHFNRVVGLTGIALTKLDGTAKGGVIFALAKRFGIPIRYIGIGESINDLQDFDARSFIDALFATSPST